tara:strand:- start:2566 stop:2817 length:252 start_codon:yes stop_codon:yes gene_type:complete
MQFDQVDHHEVITAIFLHETPHHLDRFRRTAWVGGDTRHVTIDFNIGQWTTKRRIPTEEQCIHHGRDDPDPTAFVHVLPVERF